MDSTLQEEMATLELFLTRLVLTEDDKIEKVLSKLLPFAISKLSSPHEASRKKVMEMLSHINRRIRDQNDIKLPLNDLLAMYRSPSTSGTPLVNNFSIVYVEMAFERTPNASQIKVLPDLLSGISSRPAQHKFILQRCAALAMEAYGSPRGVKSEEIDSQTLEFGKHKEDAQTWLEFCLCTLLYLPQTQAAASSTAGMAGLSPLQAQWVTGNAKQTSLLHGGKLALRKLGIINFNVALGFSNQQLYSHFLVAACDSNDMVSKRGEELLKRRAGSMNLDNKALMRRLFSLYLGSPSSAPAESAVAPASIPLKIRLISAFNHSTVAANCFPFTLQVILDAIYGEGSTMKLKQAGMEFAVWVFKHASESQLKPTAPIILSSLVTLLGNSEGTQDQGMQHLRAFTYQAIGQLSSRVPHLFSGSAMVAKLLFNAVKQEGAASKSVVQDAVTTLAGAYEGSSSDVVKQEIELLLLQNIASEEDAARFCAVMWASRLFPPPNPIGCYVCLLGCGDKKLEIREMSEKVLFPGKSAPEAPQQKLPGMAAMLSCIVKQHPMAAQPSKLNEQTLVLPADTFCAVLKFLAMCSLSDPSPSSESQGEFHQYRLLLEHALAKDGTWALHALAAQGLLQAGCSHSQLAAMEYSQRLPWLRQFISHGDTATRERIARLVGIVSEALSPEDAGQLISELLAQAEASLSGKEKLEVITGAVATLGYVIAQAVTGKPAVPEGAILRSVSRMAELLDLSKSEPIQLAVAQSLGKIGVRGRLPLPETLNLEMGSGSPAAAMADSKGPTKGTVLERMKTLLESKDMKTVQKSALSLGHLCFGDPSMAADVLEALFSLSRSKSEDVTFAVGESLSFIWGGVHSMDADTILRTPFESLTLSTDFLSAAGPAADVDMGDGASQVGSVQLSKAQRRIRARLFDDLLVSSRKEDRRAGSVWLLSLVTFVGKTAALQSLLPDIQESFSHLLGEGDEITQEMASRGMSLVYELASCEQKQQLVDALVGTLSGAARKKRAVKLVEDSEVFSGEGLGKAPGGGQLTTYKELCTLATDMGQPDLIYRFMELANHQSSLNSRRAAAFGVARIAQLARHALEPYLPTLLPKLMRLQYDPSKAVQDAGTHIWQALVPDPRATLDSLWDSFMEDLVREAGSHHWRSRESASLALVDILPSRKFQEVAPYLARLWTMAFRLADDIKESVRLAGDRLCKTVSSLSVRLCDPTLTDKAEASGACAIVLPILLKQGMLSSVGPVQKLSLATLAKLVKSAGHAVRGSLSDMVPAMLEGLSSLEDQNLNYAELHAERIGINPDRLESVRISHARESPMWETLDWCLREMDGPGLEALAPRLADLVRSGVGLNTRVGTARFISLLVAKVGVQEMKVHAGLLLRVLLPAVQAERSGAARKALAGACADVARCAGDARVSRLVGDVAALYDGDKEARLCSALLLRELSRSCSDGLRANADRLIPLAFSARFDEDAAVSKLFDEVWEDVCGSTSATVQIYLAEVTAGICASLQSSAWTRKQQGAKAIISLAQILKEDITQETAEKLLTALIGELPGKLWEGKESILEAIGALALNCQKVVASLPSVSPEAILRAVLAAGERKKATFREASMACLCKAVSSFVSSMDVLPIIAASLATILREDKVDPVSDVSAGSSPSRKPSTPLSEPALECLASSLPGATLSSLCDWGDAIVQLAVSNMDLSKPWTVRLGSIVLCRQLLEAATRVPEGKQEEWIQLLVCALLNCTGDGKYSQVRIKSLECLKFAMESPAVSPIITRNGEVAVQVKQSMAHLSVTDKNSNVRTLALSIIHL